MTLKFVIKNLQVLKPGSGDLIHKSEKIDISFLNYTSINEDLPLLTTFLI